MGSPVVPIVLIIGTVAAGSIVRFAPLGLPYFITKYGGSALWAMMVYWIVSTLLGSRRIPVRAALAGFAATAVEFLKLYRSPRLDAFRHTLPGILLLGRIFSGWNIAAYWVGICAAAVADLSIRKHSR